MEDPVYSRTKILQFHCSPSLKQNNNSLQRGIQNYVDIKWWVGGQPNIYACEVNDLYLLTLFVYKGWMGGQKILKFCLRSYWMPPNC